VWRPVFSAQVKHRYGDWITVAETAGRDEAVHAAALAMWRRDQYGERPMQARVIQISAPRTARAALPSTR
jgi:hypothetical protein